MWSSLDLTIREWLARYLAGENSLRQFQEWFVPATWRGVFTSAAALDLAHEVELRLAEYTNGHWTERELRSLLLPLVRAYAVDLGQARWRTASSSEVIRSRVTYQGLGVGRPLAVGSA